ncbi:MAG TPA: PEP-CTERM sorting domain-containing protein [Terriglobales bacterium]|nr:PEP-CTERM sorting domain-containing protein [Terriglobales bacterium]
MRQLAALALLALAVPTAAWADGINITNQTGTVSISGMTGTGGWGTIGVSTITSKGSQMTAWNNGAGHLGYFKYTTGALQSGSISGGGTFASGGSLDIIGYGKWAKELTGRGCGKGCDMFTGSFSSPVTWMLVSKSNQSETFALTGNFEGTLYTGRTVYGTTTQDIKFDDQAQLGNGIGYIGTRTSHLSTPEPETLGLLGIGLLGVAGMFRRKLIKG